ncbi:MAG: UPF0175 family protein [Gemmatimonadetes bacterium]|nr:UPF0175 family protein [Gemmatimonadota bacterium]MYK51918.1 UPF0175 family protein [Gemmatimonadota bacterium]
MSSIKIECPAHILDALKETPDEFAREARILLAAKLYEIGRLSSGRAAELAGLGRVAFFDMLKSYKVPVANLTSEELKKDFESAGKMRG